MCFGPVPTGYSTASNPRNGSTIRVQEGDSATVECAIFNADHQRQFVRWLFFNADNSELLAVNDVVRNFTYEGTPLPHDIIRTLNAPINTYRERIILRNIPKTMQGYTLTCSGLNLYDRSPRFYFHEAIFIFKIYRESLYYSLC